MTVSIANNDHKTALMTFLWSKERGMIRHVESFRSITKRFCRNNFKVYKPAKLTFCFKLDTAKIQIAVKRHIPYEKVLPQKTQ